MPQPADTLLQNASALRPVSSTVALAGELHQDCLDHGILCQHMCKAQPSALQLPQQLLSLPLIHEQMPSHLHA